jgi:hypothetical protein
MISPIVIKSSFSNILHIYDNFLNCTDKQGNKIFFNIHQHNNVYTITDSNEIDSVSIYYWKDFHEISKLTVSGTGECYVYMKYNNELEIYQYDHNHIHLNNYNIIDKLFIYSMNGIVTGDNTKINYMYISSLNTKIIGFVIYISLTFNVEKSYISVNTDDFCINVCNKIINSHIYVNQYKIKLSKI